MAWPRSTRFVLVMSCMAMTCCFVSCDNDLKESVYHSLAEARTDGAVDRGWIPAVLPQTAQNIHELHEVSSGKTWCMFDFAPADWEPFRKNLKGRAVAPVDRVSPPHVSWWPTLATGKLDFDGIHNAGLELYAFARPDNAEVILLVIDSPKGRGFFYRVPR